MNDGTNNYVARLGRSVMRLRAESDYDAIVDLEEQLKEDLRLRRIDESDTVKLERTSSSPYGCRRIFAGTVARFMEYADRAFVTDEFGCEE